MPSSRSALMLALTVMAATGCGGSGSGVPVLVSTPLGANVPGRTWMSPEAKSGDLLYVSADSGIYVYSYPAGELVGQLTTRGNEGLCSDSNGNIFVPTVINSGSRKNEVLEYAHGGKHPIRTLRNAGTFPYGCAVDPTTGNLAVTDFCATIGASCGGPGSLEIYVGGRGSPHAYTIDHFSTYGFCTYNAHGDLFVDGTVTNGFKFAELLAGRKHAMTVSLDQTFSEAGGVQWDGTHVVVGDGDDASAIYQFAIKGARGVKVGTTPLGGVGGSYGFWIGGPTVVAPSFFYDQVGFYNYPAGGSPTKTLTLSSAPFAVTVSVAPRF